MKNQNIAKNLFYKIREIKIVTFTGNVTIVVVAFATSITFNSSMVEQSGS